MEDNKILYTVYYDPKLSHEFTGPSPPGCTLPPLNFRHAAQNTKRNGKAGSNAKVKTENKVVFTEPIVAAAPSRTTTRTKRKLSYSDNLVTFAVEAPRVQKKGRLSENQAGRDGFSAQGGPAIWGHSSSASSSSDFQEGPSMSSNSSYTSLSSFSLPSPIPFQAAPFNGHVKMQPPIDPLLTGGFISTGNTQKDAALAALASLDKAGISPLEMLLMILDPANAELERARNEFFEQKNHAHIHALLTNLQSNPRLRQDFQGVGSQTSAQVLAFRHVGGTAAVATA